MHVRSSFAFALQAVVNLILSTWPRRLLGKRRRQRPPRALLPLRVLYFRGAPGLSQTQWESIPLGSQPGAGTDSMSSPRSRTKKKREADKSKSSVVHQDSLEKQLVAFQDRLISRLSVIFCPPPSGMFISRCKGSFSAVLFPSQQAS